MQKITKKTYLKWYEDMLFWRKFEDKLAAVYIQQKVRGFLHLYNGQEAVLAGALHAMDLTKDNFDTISTGDGKTVLESVYTLTYDTRMKVSD